MEDLMAHSDVIVECSGDILHASNTVQAAHEAGLPVVTMGAEFHVTVGSYFCNSGILTEAEGDQPDPWQPCMKRRCRWASTRSFTETSRAS